MRGPHLSPALPQAMRGIVQGCASPERMSRTEMALLTCVMCTASQVLTTDSKSAIVEANIFNLFAVDGFQAVPTALVPTAWNHCRTWMFPLVGDPFASGTFAVDCPPASHGGCTICELAGLDTFRLGSRHLVGHGSSIFTCGSWCLRCSVWNGWWQWPLSASERLSRTLRARAGSLL